MSDTTKTAILQIVIDRQAAVTGLQETEKKIIELKDAQKELNREFNNGKISVEQYTKYKVELDQSIVKETQSRKVLQQAVAAENNSLNAQKALLGELIIQRNNINRSTDEGAKKFDLLNSRIKELNKSLGEAEKQGGVFGRNVGNYPEKLKSFADNVQVGNVSLGAFAKTAGSLISPLGAVAAGITALGTAYVSSAAGAKDLEEAQNRLKAEFAIFSGAIGGDIGKEGEGFIDNALKYTLGLAKGIVSAFGDIITLGQGGFIKGALQDEKQTEKLVHAYNELKQLSFEQLENEKKSADLRRDAFKLTVIRGDTEKSLNERLQAAHKITENLKTSQEDQVEALKKQAGQLVKIGELSNNDVRDQKNISELRKAYLSLLVQISDAEGSRERKIAAALLAEQKLTQELNKQKDKIPNFSNKKDHAEAGKQQAKDDFAAKKAEIFQESANKAKVENEKITADSLKKIDADYQKAKQDGIKNTVKEEQDELHKKQAIAREEMNLMHATNRLASQLLGQKSDEYKAFANAQAIISTFMAADNALADIPYPANLVAVASVIAEGLANVVEINKAAGGGSFVTKGPTMLLVGDNPGGVERVDVTPVSGKGETKVSSGGNLIAMAGGGSLYTNGGLMTNNSTASIDNQLLMANAFKNMPQPIVSWKEGLIMNDRISFKEGLTQK